MQRSRTKVWPFEQLAFLWAEDGELLLSGKNSLARRKMHWWTTYCPRHTEPSRVLLWSKVIENKPFFLPCSIILLYEANLEVEGDLFGATTHGSHLHFLSELLLRNDAATLEDRGAWDSATQCPVVMVSWAFQAFALTSYNDSQYRYWRCWNTSSTLRRRLPSDVSALRIGVFCLIYSRDDSQSCLIPGDYVAVLWHPRTSIDMSDSISTKPYSTAISRSDNGNYQWNCSCHPHTLQHRSCSDTSSVSDPYQTVSGMASRSRPGHVSNDAEYVVRPWHSGA